MASYNIEKVQLNRRRAHTLSHNRDVADNRQVKSQQDDGHNFSSNLCHHDSKKDEEQSYLAVERSTNRDRLLFASGNYSNTIGRRWRKRKTKKNETISLNKRDGVYQMDQNGLDG